MRCRSLRGCLAISLAAAACGNGVEISGTLADGVEATHVWVVGVAERDSVEDGSFRVRGVPSGVVDIRFGTADDEVGVIYLTDVPPRSRIRMDGIARIEGDSRWIPAAVALRGASTVTVNGVRMGPPPIGGEDTIEVRGEVIAAASDIRRVLIRAEAQDWPDLEVSVPTNVEVRDGEDKEVALHHVRFGDTGRVEIAGRDSDAYLARSLRIDRVVEIVPERPRIIPTPPTRPRILGEPAPRSGVERQGPPAGRGQGRGRGRGRGPP